LNLDFTFTKNQIKQRNKAYEEINIVKKQRKRSNNPKLKNKPIFISLNDPSSRFMKNKKGNMKLS
jgi:hypothetical protein